MPFTVKLRRHLSTIESSPVEANVGHVKWLLELVASALRECREGLLSLSDELEVLADAPPPAPIDQAAVQTVLDDSTWPTVTEAAEDAGVTAADIVKATERKTAPLKTNRKTGPDRRIDPGDLIRWKRERRTKKEKAQQAAAPLPHAKPDRPKPGLNWKCRKCGKAFTLKPAESDCPFCGGSGEDLEAA